MSSAVPQLRTRIAKSSMMAMANCHLIQQPGHANKWRRAVFVRQGQRDAAQLICFQFSKNSRQLAVTGYLGTRPFPDHSQAS